MGASGAAVGASIMAGGSPAGGGRGGAVTAEPTKLAADTSDGARLDVATVVLEVVGAVALGGEDSETANGKA